MNETATIVDINGQSALPVSYEYPPLEIQLIDMPAEARVKQLDNPDYEAEMEAAKGKRYFATLIAMDGKVLRVESENTYPTDKGRTLSLLFSGIGGAIADRYLTQEAPAKPVVMGI